jgi:hypothetical protein
LLQSPHQTASDEADLANRHAKLLIYAQKQAVHETKQAFHEVKQAFHETKQAFYGLKQLLWQSKWAFRTKTLAILPLFRVKTPLTAAEMSRMKPFWRGLAFQ